MKQYSTPPAMSIEPEASYSAKLVTNAGTIEIDLLSRQAPKTVNNFVFLARDGFYTGTIFHRVIQNFMIQGGDPEGSGRGGPGYKFEDEFDPSLKFDGAGILAMANAGPNTNGSQFFITVATTPHLNNAHTIFGLVTQGYDVVESISTAETDAGNRPSEDVIIQSIEIIEYPTSES